MRRTEMENLDMKRIFPEVLKNHMGIVTYACNELKIHRATYYWWYKHDKAFAKACDEVIEHMADVVESELYKKIMGGDTACIIFYCKTKLKHRGYVERTEQLHGTAESLNNIKLTEQDNEILERALERRMKRIKYADTTNIEEAENVH